MNALQTTLGSPVTIREGKKKGKIIIEFNGESDLERLAHILLGA